MNSIKHLTNDALEQETLTTARREQATTLELLNYLAEIDARKLYATRGYPSLFSYVHQVLGYSEPQASERVSAMRLMVKTPEVKVALQNNELNLTSTSRIARFLRTENPSPEKADQIIKACKKKSTREVETILIAHSTAPIQSKPDQLKPVSVDHARLSIDCDAEMVEHLRILQNLSSDPTVSLKDIVKQALAERVNRLQKRRGVGAPAKPATPNGGDSLNDQTCDRLHARELRAKTESMATDFASTESAPSPQPSASSIHTASLEMMSQSPKNPPRTRHIPVPTRRLVFTRAQHQCEYMDHKTKKRCDAKHHLQIDHITPFAQGGTHDPINLQILCATHNQLKVPPVYRHCSKKNATKWRDKIQKTF